MLDVFIQFVFYPGSSNQYLASISGLQACQLSGLPAFVIYLPLSDAALRASARPSATLLKKVLGAVIFQKKVT